MQDPFDIPIHYDHVLGASPEWRGMLRAAFKGNFTPMQRRMAFLGGISPSTVHFMEATKAYAEEGHQTFCVGPAMQEVFEECPLKDVPLDLLRLPYDCFWISLPECPHFIWGDDRTGWHSIGGCYLHKHLEGPYRFRVLVWGRPNEKSTEPGDDANFWFDLDLEKCNGFQEDGHRIIDIEDYLVRSLASDSNDRSDPSIRQEAAKHLSETCAHFMSVLRIALNLVLYLDSDQAELEMDDSRVKAYRDARKAVVAKKNPVKRRKAEERADALSQARITWLGRSLERRAKSASDSFRHGVRLHRRRGHRHRYWTGSRLSDDGTSRKGACLIVKFVAPMWIGGKITLDMEEKSKHPGRVYRLEDDQSI